MPEKSFHKTVAEKNQGLLTQEQQEIASRTTLLVPHNDGEAAMIIAVARKLGFDVRVSSQAWGARLDTELGRSPHVPDGARPQVWVVEMPSRTAEQMLREKGLHVEVIDHHFYEDDDRSHPRSSLESSF